MLHSSDEIQLSNGDGEECDVFFRFKYLRVAAKWDVQRRQQATAQYSDGSDRQSKFSAARRADDGRRSCREEVAVERHSVLPDYGTGYHIDVAQVCIYPSCIFGLS